MAEQPKSGDGQTAVNTAGVPTVKIAPEIPVIFSDGVRSQAHGPGISKFYLYRNDADPDAKLPQSFVTVAQIVMPAYGFARMVHFLQHRLDIMVRDGVISQAAIDEIRATKYPDPVDLSSPNA